MRQQHPGKRLFGVRMIAVLLAALLVALSFFAAQIVRTTTAATTHAQAGTLATAHTEPAFRAAALPPISMIEDAAYGDSVTAGVDGGGRIKAYPWYLMYMLWGGNPRILASEHTIGLPGYRAAGVLSYLQTHTIHLITPVMVIEVGTNDAQMQCSGCPPPPPPTPLATYRTTDAALVAYARHDNPNARLVCMGNWWHNETQRNSLGLTGAQYDAITQSVCAHYGGVYVPLWQICAQPQYHNTSGDLFHPSALGQAAIASAIYAALG